MTWTAFDGHRRLATGDPRDVALAIRRAADRSAAGPVLVFDDATGRVVDVDTHGTDEEIVARLATHPLLAADAGDERQDRLGDGEPGSGPAEPRRRGRPKLGVVAREVTLLPRHWDWLGTQPGGASVALRRLVDDARRANADRDRARERRDAVYRFMSAIAGDLPGFEEVARALYAGDAERLAAHIAGWPADVREHVLALRRDE